MALRTDNVDHVLNTPFENGRHHLHDDIKSKEDVSISNDQLKNSDKLKNA